MRLGAKTASIAGAFGSLGASAALLAGRRVWTVNDLYAWQILAPLAPRYLPWSTSAMRPSGVVAILNDISHHEHDRVVECGGGISSLFIARLLRERDGRLTVLEHDEGWAERVHADLKREGLTSIAEVRLAPLREHRRALAGNRWYDDQVVDELTGSSQFDLLSVDGPPAHDRGSRGVRYPALAAFVGALTPGATIVLDDVERRSERSIVRRWESESDFRFDVRIDPGGIAIGRRAGHPILAP